MSEQNPPAGGTTTDSRSDDGSSTEKPTRIRDFGPAWITAIAALITAVTACATFFLGRATAPGTSTRTSSSAPQVAQPTLDRPSPTPPQDYPSAVSNVAEGAVIKQCTVDVTGDYGIDIDRTPVCPKPVSENRGPALTFTSLTDLYASGVSIALLDTDNPSYDTCSKDTRYGSPLKVQVGSVVCVTAPGIVAAMKVANQDDSQGFGSFTTLDVTVWRAPQN